jgi:hypothetical protein
MPCRMAASGAEGGKIGFRGGLGARGGCWGGGLGAVGAGVDVVATGGDWAAILELRWRCYAREMEGACCGCLSLNCP